MGTATEFLGELIVFLVTYLGTHFVFGMSILQIWFIPVLLGMLISLILGRAKVYRNSTTSEKNKKEG